MLASCELELVVLAYVVDESGIYQCNDRIENVLLECRSNYLVLGQDLVVIPLDGVTGSRCMVNNMSTVKLVEPSWHHGVRIVTDSGEVEEVDTFVRDVIILSYFVIYPLERYSMSQYCCIVVGRDTVCYLGQKYH